MLETHLPPVLYFPRSDVDLSVLRRADRRTFCPFRGSATRWSLRLPSRTIDDAAWSYERPLEISRSIAGYIAFYEGVVENWIAEPGVLDTPSVQDLITELPLVEWVLREAWFAASAIDLTERLGQTIVDVGLPLLQLNVGIWTLHPQLAGTTYTWVRGGKGVRVSHTPRGQRLDVEDPEFHFPIMAELRAAGGTDYVAMPLPFSDGQVHTLTLTSDHPRGFSVADLGQVFESIPVLSRLYEVHTLRGNTSVLLDTYLGTRTGKQMLNGLTQRGDGESIHAVIWFCDLRESTSMADSMPSESFLELLNLFFDSVAGAILEYDGEVLRFIGDAVLAIFPFDDAAPRSAAAAGEAARVCFKAIEAVREAERRVGEVNRARRDAGAPEIRYGIGLHVGDVTYGNIGTPERLEFTVIGAAANEAARIESLCKTLDTPVLISDDFARYFPETLVSVGRHRLRGVAGEREIFTLPPPTG